MVAIGTTPLEQPLKYSVTRVSGSSYERTWIGTKTAINAVVASIANADEIEVTGKGATYTCRARYSYDPTGGTEVPEETQEIDTEAIQQSIFTNPTFVPLQVDIVESIRKNTETRQDTSTASTGYSKGLQEIYDTCDKIDATKKPIAKKAFDLLIRGDESWETYSFVMTRSRSVSRAYAASQIELSSINLLYSTVQLVAITGNPILWTVPSLTLTANEVALNLFGGWRKKLCKVTDVAGGRRQMVEQWQLAKWSKDLYSLAP